MKKTNSCLQTPEAGAIIHLVARTAVKNHWKSGRHGQKRLTQDEKSGWQRTNDVITYGSSHVKRKFREGQDLPTSLPAMQEREKHHNKQIYDNLTEMQPWRFLWIRSAIKQHVWGKELQRIVWKEDGSDDPCSANQTKQISEQREKRRREGTKVPDRSRVLLRRIELDFSILLLTGCFLFNMRVWSWLRMNAGGVPNTCKSNGDI